MANLSAWELLRGILETKPHVRNELPHEIANWIDDESRHGKSDFVQPSNIEQIEAEVEELKRQFLAIEEQKSVVNGDREKWIHGWRIYEGDWTPRPIGIL
jgi:late competence protein required for DNA uptake (superfamily II DNA/RNA helicase)